MLRAQVNPAGSCFAILFSDLVLGDTLGEGSFGTVVKGVLRGNISVAVKTLRVTKLSSEVLDKFKQELKVSGDLIDLA